MGNIQNCFSKHSKCGRCIDITVWVASYFIFVFFGGLLISYIEKEVDYEQKTSKRKAVLDTFEKYNITFNNTMVFEMIKVVTEAYDVKVFNFKNVTQDVSSSWNIASSVFFCSTVITTIGYGTVTPITKSGRLFTILYAVIGIPLTGIVLAKIGGVLTDLVKACDDFIGVNVKKVVDTFESDELKIKLYVRIVQLVMTLFVILLFFLFIPAAIIGNIEKWTYLDSIYFCFISVTTIGLGDLTPGSSTSNIKFKQIDVEDLQTIMVQICVLLYLLLGLSAITIIIKLGSSLANIVAGSTIEKAGDMMLNNGKTLLTNIRRKTQRIAPNDLMKGNSSSSISTKSTKGNNTYSADMRNKSDDMRTAIDGNNPFQNSKLNNKASETPSTKEHIAPTNL